MAGNQPTKSSITMSILHDEVGAAVALEMIQTTKAATKTCWDLENSQIELST